MTKSHISRTVLSGDAGVMPPRPPKFSAQAAPQDAKADEQGGQIKASDLTKRQLQDLCMMRGVHSGQFVNPIEPGEGYLPLSKHQQKGYYIKQLRQAGKLHPLTDDEIAQFTSSGTEETAKE
jgi:hypothetical protein